MLRQWAEEQGKLKNKLPKEHVRGSEHTVEWDPNRGRVLKATRPDTHLGFGIAYGAQTPGATPSEYLDRLAIHNRIFNDQIKLEYIVPVGLGEVSIVTSQPFIKGQDAKQTEIDTMMGEKGFERIGLGTFYHSSDGILVHDLVPKNVKVSDTGYVHAIDPVIQRITPEFADYLRRNPVVPAQTIPAPTPTPGNASQPCGWRDRARRAGTNPSESG